VRRRCAQASALLVLLLIAATAVQARDIVVEALLPGLAVLQVDGQRLTLRAGEQHGDLRLIESDARSALLRIGGEERRLQVSERISSTFTPRERPTVTVRRDARLQYRTTAEINGVRLPVLVDTGANIVALNSTQAAAVGIAPGDGTRAVVETAGATVVARRVQLGSVDVGGIRVDAVEATVIDGAQPRTALLGMSFLRHVELQERDGVLTLRGRW
jgi:aspartyl protease family protein